MSETDPVAENVLTIQQLGIQPLQDLLATYHLELIQINDSEQIPGSFWGDSEAGLIGSSLYYHLQTPVHSVLHEACHYICMDSQRRAQLHTNAGGDYAEEDAVCYLQTLLAEKVEGFGRQRSFKDMDSWGYSFRLGSAHLWFEKDAQEARSWLLHYGIIDNDSNPTQQLRL